jgi:hypothetical protein
MVRAIWIEKGVVMTKKIVFAALATLGLAVVTPAYAADISTLYGTGQAASDGSDLHWTLAGGTAYVVTNVNSAWTPNTTASGWISSVADGYTSVAPITYTYSTTFSLAGLNASTASLSGVFAADDNASIYLNGIEIAAQGGTYGSTTAFSSTTGDFVAGTNTLTFVTINSGGGPAGLDVAVSGTASAVPEPATWAMMLLGFGMIGMAVRSRRRQSVSVTYA